MPQGIVEPFDVIGFSCFFVMALWRVSHCHMLARHMGHISPLESHHQNSSHKSCKTDNRFKGIRSGQALIPPKSTLEPNGFCQEVDARARGERGSSPLALAEQLSCLHTHRPEIPLSLDLTAITRCALHVVATNPILARAPSHTPSQSPDYPDVLCSTASMGASC